MVSVRPCVHFLLQRCITYVVLHLCRYLMKVYQSVASQPGVKLEDSVAYIGERDSGKSALGEDLKLQDLVQAYQHTARR